jgi:linoleate 10R-lipoxygenase
LEINERANFVDPATLSRDNPADNVKLLAQEEQIFQTARLINCGWFGMGMYEPLLRENSILILYFKVVFSDYFSAILGLVRDGSSWSLTPFDVSHS